MNMLAKRYALAVALLFSWLMAASPVTAIAQLAPQPYVLPLRDGWTLSVPLSEPPSDSAGPAENQWQRNVRLPSAWESQLGTQFDGRAIYRYQFSDLQQKVIQDQLRQAPVDSHLILRLEGVATQAEVKLNGKRVGTHLGAWTPWECPLEGAWIDPGERSSQDNGDPSSGNVLVIEVDEKVGHHTQGFLPIVAPHFGGIWKQVSLQIVPRTRVIKDRSLVLGVHGPDRDQIQFQLHTSQPLQPKDRWEVVIHPAARRSDVSNPLDSSTPWLHSSAPVIRQTMPARESKVKDQDSVYEFSITVPDAQLWSTDEPWLYTVDVSLHRDQDAQPVAVQQFRTGIRSLETQGHQLLLNGQPVNVRGVLNWGYSPPSTSPSLDTKEMAQELVWLRTMKLNLMKFCLYIPPRQYLELCDEWGVLAWIEYPTWHAQLIPENLSQLSDEYREFTWYDRNHPSVILRSLTCETGSSADLDVIQKLYDLVHTQVPQCIVEDDSSWISWNRISDFWDDHPYGNNHTWIPTIDSLKEHIRKNGAKPLILGEAIAADTWPRLQGITIPVPESQVLPEPRMHFGFEQAAGQFQQEIVQAWGEETAQRLTPDSIRYAALMRQFQIETFRREVPWGGFVLSELRDFPLASMGLVDPWGHYKFESDDPTQNLSAARHQLILETSNDRRSFLTETQATAQLYLATPNANQFRHLPVRWKLLDSDQKIIRSGTLHWKSGSDDEPDSKQVHLHSTLTFSVPGPGRFDLHVAAEAVSTEPVENQWALWSIPRSPELPDTRIHLHTSVDPSTRSMLVNLGFTEKQLSASPTDASLTIARHWDPILWKSLNEGQSVFMLPDGKANSFVTSNHWFLRGGPVVVPSNLPETLDDPSADFLVDLQHFDLAGPVQNNFVFWQHTSPALMLWDTHDIKEVRKHGLLWSANVGKGHLTVSMLNHAANHSAVGPWLFQGLLRKLAQPTEDFARAFPQSLIDQITSELNTVEINLTQQTWKLKPDPDFEGLKQGWHLADTATTDWDPIRIDSHWEGQNQAGLDGWAWYSTQVSIPKDWSSDNYYLCFTGVDDHYRAFVNGKEIGSAGVIETKETAFEMRSSYALPEGIKPGDVLTIRIAVFDWYGAGGIFRPIFLRTTPLPEHAPLLQR